MQSSRLENVWPTDWSSDDIDGRVLMGQMLEAMDPFALSTLDQFSLEQQLGLQKFSQAQKIDFLPFHAKVIDLAHLSSQMSKLKAREIEKIRARAVQMYSEFLKLKEINNDDRGEITKAKLLNFFGDISLNKDDVERAIVNQRQRTGNSVEKLKKMTKIIDCVRASRKVLDRSKNWQNAELGTVLDMLKNVCSRRSPEKKIRKKIGADEV